MLPASTHFIKNASTVKSDSRKKVMDGFVSGSLDAFQRHAVDGILKGGMPSGVHSPKGMDELVHKAAGMRVGEPKAKLNKKEPKTKLVDGYLPYPGSSKSA